MLRKIHIVDKLRSIDRKLEKDDELVKKLSDIVVKLRTATEETEAILRQLQEDSVYLDEPTE
jgi:uncharacterized protein (DUF342 family)